MTSAYSRGNKPTPRLEVRLIRYWSLCLSSQPHSRAAHPRESLKTKTVDVQGQRFELGGTYDPNSYGLTLLINGEPVLRGTFSPYVPFMLLSNRYQGQEITAPLLLRNHTEQQRRHHRSDRGLDSGSDRQERRSVRCNDWQRIRGAVLLNQAESRKRRSVHATSTFWLTIRS